MANLIWPSIINYLSNNREATLEEIADNIRSDKNWASTDNYTIEKILRKRRGFFKLLPSGKWVINKESRFFKDMEIETTIIQILKENGGHIETTNKETGWTIYQEIADRLHIPAHRLQKRTKVTGERSWRSDVGYSRKRLVEWGYISPTSVSGRGVWQLTKEGMNSNF